MGKHVDYYPADEWTKLFPELGDQVFPSVHLLSIPIEGAG